jgi:hypothetical protein
MACDPAGAVLLRATSPDGRGLGPTVAGEQAEAGSAAQWVTVNGYPRLALSDTAAARQRSRWALASRHVRASKPVMWSHTSWPR